MDLTFSSSGEKSLKPDRMHERKNGAPFVARSAALGAYIANNISVQEVLYACAVLLGGTPSPDPPEVRIHAEFIGQQLVQIATPLDLCTPIHAP
jgi:hypothetical protein